jgi:hypothetical protein
MQSTVCSGFAGDTQPSVQVELVDPVSASGLASRIETSDAGRRSGVRRGESARSRERARVYAPPSAAGEPSSTPHHVRRHSARRCVSWKNLYRQPSATGPLIHLA